MASIMEAYNALLQNEEDNKERVVSWREKKAKLWGTTMAWDDGTLVRLCASTISDWSIEELKPEKGYIDCPVFKRDHLWRFYYNGESFPMSAAQDFDLIGYVYKGGAVRGIPAIPYGGKEVVRCIAVRITR